MKPYDFPLRSLLLLAFLASIFAVKSAVGQRMYFTDTVNGAIWSANVDASEITLLVSQLSSPRGIAVDPIHHKMVWVDYGTNRIETSRLDGLERRNLPTQGVDGPRGIALDLDENMMYWTNRTGRTVRRANTDGSDSVPIISTSLSYPYTVALDTANDFVYWEDRETRVIQRANLNGANRTTLLTLDAAPGFLPVGFDIDWQDSHIYFANGGATQTIYRADLDGSNQKLFIPTVSNVRAVTFESKNRMLYWVEDDGTQDIIRRSSLDRRVMEDVLYAPQFAVRAIAFDYRSTVRGDFNYDEVLDVDDIESLVANYGDPINVEKYDLNGDVAIDSSDVVSWVKEIRKTWIGDANLDGEFSTRDLVQVFQAGQYEDGIPNNSAWDTGDWNLDGEFSTSDLVVAFQDGGFELGPVTAVATQVPEPSALAMLLVALSCCSCRSRCKKTRRTPPPT